MVDLGGYVIILVETHDKKVKLYGKQIIFTLILCELKNSSQIHRYKKGIVYIDYIWTFKERNVGHRTPTYLMQMIYFTLFLENIKKLFLNSAMFLLLQFGI